MKGGGEWKKVLMLEVGGSRLNQAGRGNRGEFARAGTASSVKPLGVRGLGTALPCAPSLQNEVLDLDNREYGVWSCRRIGMDQGIQRKERISENGNAFFVRGQLSHALKFHTWGWPRKAAASGDLGGFIQRGMSLGG